MGAKFRAGRPVTVLTTCEQVARQTYGYMSACKSIIIPSLEETDSAVDSCIASFKADGVCKEGDSIVIVQGKNKIVGSTNTMRIQYASTRNQHTLIVQYIAQYSEQWLLTL